MLEGAVMTMGLGEMQLRMVEGVDEKESIIPMGVEDVMMVHVKIAAEKCPTGHIAEVNFRQALE